MLPQHTGMMRARHLSKIQEEPCSRELSTSSLPPPVEAGAADQQGEDEDEDEDEEGPASQFVPEQQRKEDERKEERKEEQSAPSLLEELGRVEAELRHSLHLEAERQQEAEFLRRQENKLMWQNLCYLSLSQRVAKPWVSSYFRKFPMHIYCLPVQPANHRGRGRGLRKTR